MRAASRAHPTLPASLPPGLLAGAQEVPPDLCFNQLQVSGMARRPALRADPPASAASCRRQGSHPLPCTPSHQLPPPAVLLHRSWARTTATTRRRPRRCSTTLEALPRR